MSASELLSSRLMFPTPLASDKGTVKDAQSLDVYLSDNGIFRKKNKSGAIWSLPLSAAVFYLTPVASDGFRSTLKPSAYDPKKKNGNLAAQVIFQENPLSDKAALNPDLWASRKDGRSCPLEQGAGGSAPHNGADQRPGAPLKDPGECGLPSPGVSYLSLYGGDTDRQV